MKITLTLDKVQNIKATIKVPNNVGMLVKTEIDSLFQLIEENKSDLMQLKQQLVKAKSRLSKQLTHTNKNKMGQFHKSPREVMINNISLLEDVIISQQHQLNYFKDRLTVYQNEVYNQYKSTVKK